MIADLVAFFLDRLRGQGRGDWEVEPDALAVMNNADESRFKSIESSNNYFAQGERIYYFLKICEKKLV